MSWQNTIVASNNVWRPFKHKRKIDVKRFSIEFCFVNVSQLFPFEHHVDDNTCLTCFVSFVSFTPFSAFDSFAIHLKRQDDVHVNVLNGNRARVDLTLKMCLEPCCFSDNNSKRIWSFSRSSCIFSFKLNKAFSKQHELISKCNVNEHRFKFVTFRIFSKTNRCFFWKTSSCPTSDVTVTLFFCIWCTFGLIVNMCCQ